jgi:hypothetical protein
MFRHAKQRCRPKNPKCSECALLRLCPYGQRVVRHRPPDRKDELLPVLRRRRAAPLARFASAGIAKQAEAD